MSDSATEAVLYVCAERGTQTPALAEERALQEGRAFAGERDLRLGEEITDHFGEVDPGKRPGWQRVRGMVARGEVTTVIVRWPNAISTDQELRYAEIAWCQEHGVRVQFSWAPLSELGGQGR
ncbi:recombinase family protein [Streptomyces sp. NPDC007808]|uniref:recombinase family protein n=1 Tax=Streptomyces sp. NPDC007808 TaxID=3364779 RepID=UPI0036B112E5